LTIQIDDAICGLGRSESFSQDRDSESAIIIPLFNHQFSIHSRQSKSTIVNRTHQ